VFQYAYLLLCLSVKAFFVADHLECNADTGLMVVRVNNLPEAAFAEHFEYLISVGDVVVWHLQKISHISQSTNHN